MKKSLLINSFIAFFRKEISEGVRTYRFLILTIGVLFFAISDPILLKLLPKILASQVGGLDLGSMIELSQKAAMASFTKNLYQIGTLIVVFTLMGLISGEKTGKTLTIPISMGCSISGVLYSKTIIYGIYMALVSVAGVFVAWIYSGIIFEPGFSTFAAVLKSGLLYGMHFIFVISLLNLFGSLIEKPFIVGITALFFVYMIPVLGNIKILKEFLPSELLTEANLFRIQTSADFFITIASTLVLVVFVNFLTVQKLRRTEFV